MNRKIIAAGTALAATLVTGGTLVSAAPAQADVERTATCAGATFELSVDRERRAFEVDADIDGARPGSTWRVVLRHEGKVVHSRTHRADAEGEIDVDRRRPNTAGKDTFVLRVKPAGNASCWVRVKTR